MSIVLLGALGYLLGSVPFGLIVSKIAGNVNLREYGSGNIGATNVMRALGKGAAVATFVGDFGKGIASVLLAGYLAPDSQADVVAGLASITGHIFPVFAKFKGGKGITTAFAVFMLLASYPTLMALGIWIIFCAAWRYVSLSSLAANFALPLLVLAMAGPKSLFLATLLSAALITARHRDNLRRLILGTEQKIGQRVKMECP